MKPQFRILKGKLSQSKKQQTTVHTLCQPHQFICSKNVEADGLHGLDCNKQIGRLPRHTEGNILIKRAYAQLDIPSILEPNHLR